MTWKPFKALRLTLAAALAAGALAACGDPQGADRAPEAGDVAVAKVDEHTVWASDVKREAVAQGLIGEGEPLDVSSEMFRRVLDEVVDQKLLAAEAIKRKLDKDPDAQRRLAAARERILGDMLVEGVVTDAVSENAVKALYQEQLKLSRQTDEIRARQIVAGSQAEAQQIAKLVTAGGNFESLAMERSIDPDTRFNGGDLGYFAIDVMPEAYAAALKDAQTGAIVGPFAVEQGWAVVKVEDRRPEPPLTLDAARPQIVRFLTYDQIRDLLERLRGRAKIEVLNPAQPAPGTRREPASAPKAAKTPAPKPAAKPTPPPVKVAPPPAKPAAKPAARPAAKLPARTAPRPARPAQRPAAEPSGPPPKVTNLPPPSPPAPTPRAPPPAPAPTPPANPDGPVSTSPGGATP